MAAITMMRQVNAPPELVFNTLADINNYAQAVPSVSRVEFLSAIRSGLGTRFCETRSIKGREVTSALEVTEYVAGDHLRLVAESVGTVWDIVMTVAPGPAGTTLTLQMELRPHRLLPKMLVFVINMLVRRSMMQDMDAAKAYCEQRAG